MDLEGVARRLIPDEEEARKRIVEWLEFYKGKRELNYKIASSVLTEVKNSLRFTKFAFPISGLRAGETGLGSRGLGDNLIHRMLFKLSKIDLQNYDDAGLREDVVVAIDGIHSRLSYFPFLAGFHATRASLRDIMVKGARPLGLLVDIHLSDDSDVGMLFDFQAGVSTVSEAMSVPILTGSTLRIGGDVVIGERISGAVGAVGKRTRDYSRRNVKKGLRIVMTEGHGGGTISSMALFYGIDGVVEETLRLQDLRACEVVREKLYHVVKSMTDVTNGGIRGDALEISQVSSVSFVIDESRFVNLVNPKIMKVMEEMKADVFGLSIDSILIFTDDPDAVIGTLVKENIRSDVIGEVTEWRGYPILTYSGKEMRPSFRETPYTPVKAVIGNSTPYTLGEIETRLNEALEASLKKKEWVLKNLKVTNR